MKFLIRIIGPIIFICILYFYVDFDALWKILLVLNWKFFWVSLVLVLFIIITRGFRWQRILSALEMKYSTIKCLRIYLVETVAVMVITSVGTFIKVFYLKRDGYGLLKPSLSIAVDKYFDYFLPLLFGLISLIIVRYDLSQLSGYAIFFLALCFSYLPAKRAYVYILPRILPKRIKIHLKNNQFDINARLSEIENGLNLSNYVLSVIGFGLHFLSVYCLSQGLNLALSFFQIILIMTITTFITLIPISVLGVGTRDIGLLGIFTYLGRTPEQAVALSVALLLLRIALIMTGSIFWFMDPPPLTDFEDANRRDSNGEMTGKKPVEPGSRQNVSRPTGSD